MAKPSSMTPQSLLGDPSRPRRTVCGISPRRDQGGHRCQCSTRVDPLACVFFVPATAVHITEMTMRDSDAESHMGLLDFLDYFRGLAEEEQDAWSEEMDAKREARMRARHERSLHSNLNESISGPAKN